MIAWTRMVPDEEASQELNDALELARTPHGTGDNVMRVHSLRPSSMRGHIAIYRATLHDDTNILPGWLQETISSYVSILNGGSYSFANHWANARHLIVDDRRAAAIEATLCERRPQDAFDGRELALLCYTDKLITEPGRMDNCDVDSLCETGRNDGEILKANQIVCYFNYANRLLNGLGVTRKGDVIGYCSPSEASHG